jgi:hypothetical protein
MVRTRVQTNHMCDCPNRLHIDVVGTAERLVRAGRILPEVATRLHPAGGGGAGMPPGMPPGIVEMVRRLSIDGGDAVEEEEEEEGGGG